MAAITRGSGSLLIVSPTESSLPVLPVARSSACVRNRDDVDVLVPHTIDQPIGKSSEQPRASSASGCPDLWAGADQFDCVGYGVEELTAEADALLFEPG